MARASESWNTAKKLLQLCVGSPKMGCLEASQQW
jgi:hypothetical protein